MPIQVLLPKVASQIAAGEVVERPASVVKELVENSLDAEASHIAIYVEGGGRRLIEVGDDGSGIPAEELHLASVRHATSKLFSADELFQIRTLGFRGEALASIGSVSRLCITSRASGESTGARLVVEGGHADPVQRVGAAQGTLVRVQDLFFNVPARLKFLKKEATERRVIDELVTRYALAYPRVRFHLHQEGNLTLQSSGNGDRREVLAALYGVDIARQMLEVLANYEAVNITGFISPTSMSRSNRREITIFVNGRWIQDPALTSALIQAYHTLLMVGRFPLAVLFIDITPELVDVNVHPAKAEVRFRDRDRVFSAVQRAVRRALMAYTPVPPLGGWTAGGDAFQNSWVAKSGWPDESLGGDSIIGSQVATSAQAGWNGAPPLSATQKDITSSRVPLLRSIGQVASAYLVAEGPDGLYLIDQHAAHERILFERFREQRKQAVARQSLLEPAAIDLPPASARLLEEQLPLLTALGFQVEPFGMNTFLVRAIPALIAGSDPAVALRSLVEDFEEDETPFQTEMEARVIARICKRAAIKAGQTLSGEEQRALLVDLENCQSPRTCPHGRPTMIHLSVDLLERQFGRKGAR